MFRPTRMLATVLAIATGLGVLALTSPPSKAIEVTSPSGAIRFEVDVDAQGHPYYMVKHQGEGRDRTVLARSGLGFELLDAPGFVDRLALRNPRRRHAIERYELPWGEARQVADSFNELAIDMVADSPMRKMTLVVRVFDDGLGFRFVWPEQKSLHDFIITDELTEFAFAGDPVAWWTPAYAGNRYEYLYQRHHLSALAAMKSVRAVHTPLTLELDNGLTVSLHEAALTDYASMTLDAHEAPILRCDLVPWSDGTKVKAGAPFRSPWRTVQIAERPGDLVTSTMILSLNEPSQIADTSWITPGKYAGIWWSLHIGLESWQTGPKHGATTAKTRHMIDFAAEHGLTGVLVEGWNTGWDRGWLNEGVFDYTTPTQDYDLEGLADYARDKGVTLIGHLETGGDVRGFEARRELAFAQLERLGIRAIKTGYVSQGQGIRVYDEAGKVVAKEWQHGQYMVHQYRETLKAAAAHHLMVDAHEPIKDTGIRRTWPNMMTREGARGQEYNAWSEGNPPEHTTILPFTRMLAGPMDFTPGIFNVMIDPYKPNNRVHTTRAKQLALYVVIYSPLQMVTDLPEAYDQQPAFGFLEEVPTDWERTLVPHAAIGDYVTVVRQARDSGDWFVGSITDENARDLELSLDFLDAGRDYMLVRYADAPGTDYEHDPTGVSIQRLRVDSTTQVALDLPAGGGQAMVIRELGVNR